MGYSPSSFTKMHYVPVEPVNNIQAYSANGLQPYSKTVILADLMASLATIPWQEAFGDPYC